MDTHLTAGREFILRQGRLLERRLFATCFEGAPATGVVDVLRGYRNDDGGFGHGLEPDKRCPASLPIDVEVALQALVTAGASDKQLVADACDYLASVAVAADSGGAVPLAFPLIEGYPRAEHWTDWTYQPALPLPDEVHALNEVLAFLAHAPEREPAEAVASRVREKLTSVSMFRLDPDAEGYGLSPLSVAPAADSRWRVLFSDDVINAHLDRLQRRQEPDGGWPISWDPPSEASRLEWRGVVTLGALRTLASYGRLA